MRKQQLNTRLNKSKDATQQSMFRTARTLRVFDAFSEHWRFSVFGFFLLGRIPKDLTQLLGRATLAHKIYAGIFSLLKKANRVFPKLSFTQATFQL